VVLVVRTLILFLNRCHIKIVVACIMVCGVCPSNLLFTTDFLEKVIVKSDVVQIPKYLQV